MGEPAGDLLIECDGTERLPERLGSLGEGGGPIVATLTIVASAAESIEGEEGMGRGTDRWGNFSSSWKEGVKGTDLYVL